MEFVHENLSIRERGNVKVKQHGQEVMSETSTVLPPALSAMEYVSVRPLLRAFFSRLACLLAAFSSGVSMSLCT